MKLHRVCAAMVIALCMDPRTAWPQAAAERDERVDRIVGAAMAGGGLVPSFNVSPTQSGDG